MDLDSWRYKITINKKKLIQKKNVWIFTYQWSIHKKQKLQDPIFQIPVWSKITTLKTTNSPTSWNPFFFILPQAKLTPFPIFFYTLNPKTQLEPSGCLKARKFSQFSIATSPKNKIKWTKTDISSKISPS